MAIGFWYWHRSHYLSAQRHQRPRRIGASGLRLQRMFSTAQHIEQAEEEVPMGMIIQHPIHQTPRLAYDLARDGYHDLNEGLEFQTQQPELVRTILLCPATGLRQAQRRPRFQVPGQTRHHHVSPVTEQAVQRRFQSMHPSLNLLNHILLLAAAIGTIRRQHNLEWLLVPLIGDVEKVANLIEQTPLA